MLDLSAIRRGHQHFMAEHSRAVAEALDPEKLTAWEWRYISQHGGFTSHTGNLVAKTKVKVARTGKGKLIVRSTNSAKQAKALDGGSGLYGPKHAKYIIRAKNGKTLAFLVNGKLIFRRFVMHPGVRPTRFLYNANDALFRTSKQWLRGAMAKAAHKF